MQHRIVIILLLIFFIPADSFSCSAFTYATDGQIILAANADWCKRADGLITVNKRNIVKRGDSPSMTGEYATWKSKYGSITFTYICREIVQYGMNETGLTVSTMGLPGSKSPGPDHRPPLAGNVWAQYILDNCSSIEEVLNVESKIRLYSDKDQYLICDGHGKSLVVQCKDGEVLYFYNQSLPIPVLTNEEYPVCLSNYKRNKIPFNDPYHSNRRFQIGSNALEKTPELNDNQVLDYSFDLLDKMAQHPCTQWSIVFDIKNRTVYYKTKYSPNIKNFKLGDFDFSCNTDKLALDVNNDFNGNVGQYFTEYSRKHRLDVMRKGFHCFDMIRTDEQLNMIIDFIDGFQCAN